MWFQILQEAFEFPQYCRNYCLFAYFAIIQSTFRLSKGQQYLDNMLRVNKLWWSIWRYVFPYPFLCHSFEGIWVLHFLHFNDFDKLLIFFLSIKTFLFTLGKLLLFWEEFYQKCDLKHWPASWVFLSYHLRILEFLQDRPQRLLRQMILES